MDINRVMEINMQERIQGKVIINDQPIFNVEEGE